MAKLLASYLLAQRVRLQMHALHIQVGCVCSLGLGLGFGLPHPGLQNTQLGTAQHAKQVLQTAQAQTVACATLCPLSKGICMLELVR